MGDGESLEAGEGLEEDARDQSFQVVELCLPPKVLHLLQIDSLMGTYTFPCPLVSELGSGHPALGKHHCPAASLRLSSFSPPPPPFLVVLTGRVHAEVRGQLSGLSFHRSF